MSRENIIEYASADRHEPCNKYIISLESNQMRIHEFITENTVELSKEPGTMSLWHGGNLTSDLVLIPQKTGRFEYGAGLYATTHYDTARKYSKGSRKLYLLTLSQGTDANKAHVEYDKALGFINQFVPKAKRNEIIQRIDRYNQNGMIPAYVFNNVILSQLPDD